MEKIEWKSANDRHYITGSSVRELYEHGYHHHNGLSDSWMMFHSILKNRTIINRDLRIKRKYAKARRLYGSLWTNNLGIQVDYKVKRTK